MRYERLLAALVVLTAATATSTQAAEVWIQAKAVTESGAALANGTYSVVVDAEPKRTPAPSTQGNSFEPVAMYMLLSYVASPTPFLLNTPLAQGDRIVGKMTDQLVEEIGDWGVQARTTLAHSGPMAVPAGKLCRKASLRCGGT